MISRKLVLACFSIIVLYFGVTACAGAAARQEVHVLGTWTGDEQVLFEKVLRIFEERTGIDVRYEGTRDFAAVLDGRIQSGDPPDLALVPGPGQFERYARDGLLVPFDMLENVDRQRIQREYSPAWLNVGPVLDENGLEKRYGVIVRGKRKNVVWYVPERWRWPVPHTWDDVLEVSRAIAESGASPWCAGLRDSSSSGWPGTDWIEDILLHRSGADTYRSWSRGELEWKSEQVRKAWQEWDSIINLDSANNLDPADNAARRMMLLRGFDEAEKTETMFADEPGCYLNRVGYLMTKFYEEHARDLDFFDLSTADGNDRGIEIAGDILTMFHQTSAAEMLMDYLTGVEAQTIWAEPGGVISPNQTVAERHADETTRRLARSVYLASCDDVVFDASDLMPVTMRTAFYQAVIEFVAAPKRLDDILENLDAVRESAYPEANIATQGAGITEEKLTPAPTCDDAE